MEEIINVAAFIEHLIYYLKLTIYVNKGTNKDTVLEKCIQLHNRYKSIGSNISSDPANEVLVRKCYKRFNLTLKVNADNTPVDIGLKENQLKMCCFEPHTSLIANDLDSMIAHAQEYNLCALPDVPLLFSLRESKYRSLLWQYTRSLFYISQLLVNKHNKTNSKQLTNQSTAQLEIILTNIATLEQELKVSHLMATDGFLMTKLIADSNSSAMNNAAADVKELFHKNGLSNNNVFDKILTSIPSKLDNVNLADANIFESIFSIANDIANEVKDDFEANPDGIQSALSAVTSLLKNYTNDTNNEFSAPFHEISNMIGSLDFNNLTNNQSNEAVLLQLNNVMKNNLDKIESMD